MQISAALQRVQTWSNPEAEIALSLNRLSASHCTAVVEGSSSARHCGADLCCTLMSAQLEKSRAEIALSLNKTKYLPLNKQWWRGQQYKVLRSIWQERAGEAAARAQVHMTARVAVEHSSTAGWGSRCWTPRYTQQHKLLRSLWWKQAVEAAPRLLQSDTLPMYLVIKILQYLTWVSG